MFSDNGRGFCGPNDRQPYELSLQFAKIEPSAKKVNRPQSNRMVERFQPRPIDEHFRVEGRRI